MNNDTSINSLIGHEYQPEKPIGAYNTEETSNQTSDVEKVTDLWPNNNEKMINTTEVISNETAETVEKEKHTETINTIGNIKEIPANVDVEAKSEEEIKYFEDTPVDPASTDEHQKANDTEAEFIEGQMEEAARASR
jgi:hypothetical protein